MQSVQTRQDGMNRNQSKNEGALGRCSSRSEACIICQGPKKIRNSLSEPQETVTSGRRFVDSGTHSTYPRRSFNDFLVAASAVQE
jgi:hypothetical protein